MSQFMTHHTPISLWLNKMGVKNYTIRAGGIVDVNGSVTLVNRKLTEIPVQFGKVADSFSCTTNKLTSLAGSPLHVGSSFYCSDNKLTSFDKCPVSVGEYFIGGENQITSGVLCLLLINGLMLVSLDNEDVENIINKHLKADRDIFACQQKLIEAGFEEYAQL